MAERTIKAQFFLYAGGRVAQRGDTVDLSDEDTDRGERLGAFEDGGPEASDALAGAYGTGEGRGESGLVNQGVDNEGSVNHPTAERLAAMESGDVQPGTYLHEPVEEIGPVGGHTTTVEPANQPGPEDQRGETPPGTEAAQPDNSTIETGDEDPHDGPLAEPATSPGGPSKEDIDALSGAALDEAVVGAGIDPSQGGSNKDGSLNAGEKREALKVRYHGTA